ncbi:Kinesin heavy chain [Mycena kentingensis (nom. inval.)]|nr:Kinesin heavy chain [Mycena kentingensis (nom. inval.)]
MSNNIKVVCRFRPQNSIENREGGEIVASFSDDLTTVQMRGAAAGSGPEKDGFTFDRVFPMGTKQQEVFDYGVKDIVKDVLDGYNGTVFAYGQTGSGKTFTMMSIVESDAHLEYLVKVSYMEIYLEKIRDLLAPQNDNLQVHEEKNRGVYVKNLSDYYVSSAREVYEIMRTGGNARIVSSTNMNAESSRSHSIFLISINQRNTETGAQKTGNLYLVDLAGSEKVGKTGASGQTLEEAKKINKSLSALGMVINALTDPKVKYIPYRDSKLTRILQESLGGNSRTTLIINCSPSSYNETETISTLRFGIRAKSIKNQARVNAELSPLELKGLLHKAQAANTTYQKHIAALEAELAIWRAGGRVEESEWVTSAESAAAPKKAPASPASAGPTTPVTTSRSMTPINPAIESLRTSEKTSLRRENELSDLLAEKESALTTADKLVKELKEELSFLKEQEAGVSNENKAMSTQLNELRLQAERLNYDNKESLITIDILKEQNADAASELEEVRKQLVDMKSTQKDASAEDKEKRKQEKMAMMMAKFDAQGAFSEKDEQLRAILGKLDTIDSATSLTPDDLTAVRRQLSEGQNIIRETVDRLRQSQEENEMITRRRDELEARVTALETEYEDLLEKTINDEETSNADLAESMTEFKTKLEAQYAARREAHIGELADLRQQLELRNNEVRSLNATTESLKSVNEELKVRDMRAFAVTSAGIEGGKNLAESAQDLERTRKAINVQLAEFDGVKKSLMRDLQNRCEKVVELEIQLDEIKEQYNNVIRNSNSKAQQKKMAFLERNLEQLTLVQKQLVDQNSTLKKEAGIAERKLLARNERIQNLEALLQDADRRLSVQNQKFEAQLQAVKERLDQARAQKTASSSPLSFGRIAKPLRGGGGAGPGPTPITGGGANPLTRVQNEDGGAAQKTLGTGWQVWGSAASSKRNASMSSLTITSDIQGDALRSNVADSWSAPRSASGAWDDSVLQSSLTRPRQAGQFPAPRSEDRASASSATFPAHQPSFPIPSLGYDTSAPSVEPDLSIAMRGMVVEDDLSTRQPLVPPQITTARSSPLQQPQRNLYGAYPEYGFYSPGREPFAEPYPYYGSPDPTAYQASGLPMSPIMSPMSPYSTLPLSPLPALDPRTPVYFDYNAAARPQFFFPASQPMVFAPQSPMLASPLPVTMSEKRIEMQHNLQQQLAARNMMFGANAPQSPTVPYSPVLGYGNHLLQSNAMYGPPGHNSWMQLRSSRRFDLEYSANSSALLNEFRASRGKKWELKDIKGHFVEFSGDQHGSRFIQTELTNASNEEREKIFDEIVPENTLNLIQDVFGNYVIQKLLEQGTPSQKAAIASGMEGHIIHLSSNVYGCRVVQKAFECVSPEQQSKFVRELEVRILDCVKDSNGNHVVQKVVERVSADRLGFISAFAGHVHELASHPYGCRVFQQCLRHLPDTLTRPLVEELLKSHTSALMQDQFGNYVIQFVLEHCRPVDRTAIVGQLRPRLLFLARHKFASNVCEKALVFGDLEARRVLIEEILAPAKQPDGPTAIALLMKDQYGNYVLQRALGVAEGELKQKLVDTIRPQLAAMRKQSNGHSKHIASIERELEKLSPTKNQSGSKDKPASTNT